MSRRRLYIAAISVFAVLMPALPAAAAVQATGSASVTVVQPAGIVVVRDVLTNVNASVIIVGRAGDAVSVGVPNSVEVNSSTGESLTLGTTTQLSTNALVLSQDNVSVSVGGAIDQSGKPAAGAYGGVVVVLAQYN